ncbi:MAG: hypothetical protein D6712_07505 [Chloroflexi bacterium]|nr:MAG: hypothetical protein D6712_07505 [Chloroflexota bacterium]
MNMSFDMSHFLRNIPGAKIADSTDNAIIIRLHERHFSISNATINKYLDQRNTVNIAGETACYAPGYYEHAVDILGPRKSFLDFMNANEQRIALSSNDEQMCVELSAISEYMLIALLDQLDRQQTAQLLERMPPELFIQRRYAPDDLPEFGDLFSRVMTIKVRAPEGYRQTRQKKVLFELAQSSLFNIAYAGGFGLTLAKSWTRGENPLALYGSGALTFPRRVYDEAILPYYQLALSSDSAIYAYLLFYNILEYFYLEVAETELHQHLIDRLLDPTFSHRRVTQLRALASVVRKHDAELDDEQILADVLNEHLLADTLITWIEHYEAENGHYYTERQRLFGRSFTLKLEEESIMAQIAKRLYHLRRVLAHNVEGGSRQFVPFSDQEDVLVKELPLIRYITEQLIIKTGKDI